MSTSSRIGIFLSDDKIVLAESSSPKQQKIVSSPIGSAPTLAGEPSSRQDNLDEVQTVAVFHKLLSANNIGAGQAFLSIPNKEVFLRSFVVPSMPSSELNNVVYYEAKKYLPFDLKLLDYVYQSVPIIENKQKRLRIIFYAIRKQTLDKYDRIFKQVNFKPIIYEPALISLAKQLVAKKQMKLDQKVVVVYAHENYGQIVFYEKGIAYFVREFPLVVNEVNDPKAVPEVMRTELLREIRKSFGYYSRQFSPEKIKDVLILSSEPDKELIRILTEELLVKVRTADSSVMVGVQNFLGIDAMCACGVVAPRPASVFSSYNFLQAKAAPQTGTANAMPAFLNQFLSWKASDLLPAIQALIACAVILGGLFFFTNSKLQSMKKQNDLLEQHQSNLVNKTTEQINTDIAQQKKQLETYNKVLNDKSHMAGMLSGITRSLPDGVWLEDINIHYTSGSDITVELRGNAYLKQEGAQFRAVNKFMTNLNTEKYFSTFTFKKNTIQKKKLNGYDVSYFSITGSR